MKKRISNKFLLAILALASMSEAWAASLQVSPTSLSLPAQQQAGVFALGNTGNFPLTAQVRVFRWTQNDQGGDVLTPTDAVVVSPPMVKIAGESEQQFRVIRTQPAGAAEEAYRLIVDELPAPEARPRKGLQLVLRYSVPLFLNSAENPEAALQWRVEPAAGGKSLLVVQNTGHAHAQLSSIALRRGADDKDAQTLMGGLAGYVLPGNTWRRVLPVPPAALRQGKFTVTVNARETQPALQFATP